MRGRRPKPTRLKVLTGNPGKRPLNPDEPKPERAIPECPAELGPVARREWDRLGKELASLGLLTNLDRAALAAYCGAYALVGRGHRGDPEVRHHGEVAVGLSDPVALRLDREPASRDHDADRVGVRVHAREPQSHFNAEAKRTGFIRRLAIGSRDNIRTLAEIGLHRTAQPWPIFFGGTTRDKPTLNIR